jgi:hypothetical protein
MDVAVTVSFRRRSGECVEDWVWPTVPVGDLEAATPWRTFRWYKGQKHYSGIYWSATVRDHVIYESRLELARLLFADFDPSVHRIVAQPFLLKAEVDGKPRKHIPDYLLITDQVPVVADVKPLHRLSKARGGLHLRLDSTGGGVASRGDLDVTGPGHAGEPDQPA